ncbi:MULTISPECIES: NAD(P)-dependent oxidoreductase [unclassified Streptomyces]|uniref:NAD-dependent epimerase/dehydratase family protein n=1 Tax=unclassified Streptomyces TaxID=2593676 RepID=UPI002024A2E5|nr:MULTISPECIES: NAD-dependent epimerase/dehydratase family protein [unclassified Streptomyces]MCX4547564.1 NAD-dependent epimerase/dehydratase [Streptomyces sp. NBC_01500]
MRAVGNDGPAPPVAVVLGGAGFVGRHVCTVLRAAGWAVTAVVRRAAAAPPGCGTLRIDAVRADAATLTEALARLRPTLVVNAAGALWDVTDEELTEGNVTLVGRLVSAVAALPGPVRLVHIGSSYEYGSVPGHTALSESAPCAPASGYARTKLAGTRTVTGAVRDGRIDAVVLRVTVSVGPYASRHSLLGGLALQLAEQPGELKLPPIYGVRDLIDVRDVADAVLAAADAPEVPPVVNIGAGTGVALTDAVDALIRIAGSTAAVVRTPAPTVRRDAGTGEQPLDIGLALRELGWSPARTPADALRALWDSVAPPADGPGVPLTTLAVDGESIHG